MMASELKLAKPHNAYVVIVNPRFDRAFGEAISSFRSTYAANSFAISLVARSSETRRISDRGTPAKWEGATIVVRCGIEKKKAGLSRTEEEDDRIEDIA
jgi:hypothetical protein